MKEKFAYMILMTNQNPLDDEVIQNHVIHLRELDHQDLLLLSGPFLNKNGGVVILKNVTQSEANELAQLDPFIRDKFKTYELIEIELANQSNNYLI